MTIDYETADSLRMAKFRKDMERQRYDEDCDRFVYFAAADGLIKIGTANNLSVRMSSLKARVLAVAATAYVGGFVLEYYTQEMFIPWLRKGNERFEPCFEIYEVIAEVNRDSLYLVKHYEASGRYMPVNHNHHPIGRQVGRNRRLVRELRADMPLLPPVTEFAKAS
jgi:hypothetical protein